MKIIPKYSISLLFFLLFYNLEANIPDGEYKIINILGNRDTLKTTRSYGDWWFGPTAGFNLNLYYGNLNLIENPKEPENPFNQVIGFKGGLGSGYHIGLFGEYRPVNEKLAYNLKINLYDYRKGQNDTKPLKDTFNTKYQYESDLVYLTFSPTVNYYLSYLSGLHIFAGPDIEINLKNKFKFYKDFSNTGQITDIRKIEYDKINTRIGVSLGAGYDILMAKVTRNSSMQFSPYFSMHFGSSILSQNSSRWNNVFSRVGISIKFGIDRRVYDTLQFNPDFIAPTINIADAKIERGIDFPGFDLNLNNSMSAIIRYVERPKIIEELKETPKLALNDGINISGRIINNPEKKIEVLTNNAKRFLFSSSSTVTLSNEMKEYLDAVAELLKLNPGYEVRIVGHSDNTGTAAQNLNRSQQRAQAVQIYLMGRGIALGRLPANGQGALFPIASNATEEGRRQNRRVEINVVGN